MFLFFLQLTRVGADCSSPMIQSANHAVLRCYCMMTIPMQILVCVSWLPVDSGVESATFIWDYQHIQKGYGAIFFGIFICEMNVGIN